MYLVLLLEYEGIAGGFLEGQQQSMGNCGAKVKEAPEIGAGPPSELTLMKKMELKRVLDADGIKRQVWFCCNITFSPRS